MTLTPKDLNDATHPAVKAALERQCPCCGAQPHTRCVDLADRNPLTYTVVHRARIPQ